MSEWAGQSVYVMGLGRFGGGVGVSRYLAGLGARVVVGDRGDPKGLVESIAQLQDLIDDGVIRIAMRDHAPADLDGVDVLVVNPAVPMPWENGFIAEARSRGLRVTTEIEIAWGLLDSSKVIAVTGSAGKSTTSAMIHHALREIGCDSVLGGNIGGSLLTDVDRIAAGSVVVLELSSAMLYWLGAPGVIQASPPRVGCVTNCVSNHLDWHGSVQHYCDSKRVLAETAQNLILGTGVQDWSDDARIVVDSDAVRGCVVPGKHNGLNAAMATHAVLVMVEDADRERVLDAVRGYRGLPHRLQLVHERDGIRYFNDSKCTVPGATLLAVDAIGELVDRSKIHLIAGGYDKGSDLSSISTLGGGIAGLYGVGVTGAGLVEASSGFAKDCGSLEQAMQAIGERSRDGDVVLLSPGCASWDQFANYEERGDRFTELAQSMRGERV